jgi:hypothetical protein
LNTKKGRQAKRFLEKKILGKPIRTYFAGVVDRLSKAKGYLDKQVLKQIRNHEVFKRKDWLPFYGILGVNAINEEVTQEYRSDKAPVEYKNKKIFLNYTIYKAGLIQKYKDDEECWTYGK